MAIDDGFTVEMISAAKRKSLSPNQFALPEERAYPIDTAARVRNAAARLEQNKGGLSPEKYASAKRRIAAAAKRFGIKSEYNAPKKKALHVRADLAPGGSLHVRHMSDANGETPCGTLRASDHDGTDPVWIQIAKRGAFKGHPAGPFELNDAVFDEIVANFKATQNRRVPIDYEHASESDPTDGGIPLHGAPAQGWITQLEKRTDGLWGLVEWLPQAREQIRSGQYRYFSPAIRFNSRDRVTGAPIGARLTSGALTNTPFLDGLQKLAAKDGPTTMADMLSAVEALHESVSAATTPDDAIEACARCCDLCALCCEAFLANPTPSNEALCRQCCDLCAQMCHECCEKMGDEDPACLRACQACAVCCRSCCESPATYAAICAECCEACSACCSEMMGEPITPDEDDDSAAGMADQQPDETITMTTPAETTIPLKDHETKVSELSLQLKDEQSKREALETELKTLKDAEVARVAAEQTKRVETAFATYKDARKLTDADKDAMAIVLKSNPDLFAKLYPDVPPAQAPLLRKLADSRTGDEPSPDATVPSMKALTDKHLKAGKTIEEATSLAYAESLSFTAR